MGATTPCPSNATTWSHTIPSSKILAKTINEIRTAIDRERVNRRSLGGFFSGSVTNTTRISISDITALQTAMNQIRGGLSWSTPTTSHDVTSGFFTEARNNINTLERECPCDCYGYCSCVTHCGCNSQCVCSCHCYCTCNCQSGGGDCNCWCYCTCNCQG